MANNLLTYKSFARKKLSHLQALPQRVKRGINCNLLSNGLTYLYIFERMRWNKMSSKEVLEQAMALKPEGRFMIVESLLKSLDASGRKIDEIWAEEAAKRLKAYRDGNLEGISMEEIFRD